MNALVERIESIAGAFVDFSGAMLLQSSILILIILAIDRFSRRRVRSVWRYWLWMLVVAKLLLPPSLASPVSVGYWFHGAIATGGRHFASLGPADAPAGIAFPAAPESRGAFADFAQGAAVAAPVWFGDWAPAADSAAATVSDLSAPSVPPSLSLPSAPGAAGSLSWKGVLFLAWLLIVVVLFALMIQRALYVRQLVRRAREAGPELARSLEECRAIMGVRRAVRIRLSAEAPSPSICGLTRPVILLPEALAATLRGEQLRAVLLHELAHYRRGDLWASLLQAVLQIAYFYHPLVWLANARIRRVREQAVDEAVLATIGADAREAYLRTLVEVARAAFRRTSLSLQLIGVVESQNTLKERIRTMMNRPVPGSAKLGVAGVLAILAMGLLLMPMARGEREEAPPSANAAATTATAATNEATASQARPSAAEQPPASNAPDARVRPVAATGAPDASAVDDRAPAVRRRAAQSVARNVGEVDRSVSQPGTSDEADYRRVLREQQSAAATGRRSARSDSPEMAQLMQQMEALQAQMRQMQQQMERMQDVIKERQVGQPIQMPSSARSGYNPNAGMYGGLSRPGYPGGAGGSGGYGTGGAGGYGSAGGSGAGMGDYHYQAAPPQPQDWAKWEQAMQDWSRNMREWGEQMEKHRKDAPDTPYDVAPPMMPPMPGGGAAFGGNYGADFGAVAGPQQYQYFYSTPSGEASGGASVFNYELAPGAPGGRAQPSQPRAVRSRSGERSAGTSSEGGSNVRQNVGQQTRPADERTTESRTYFWRSGSSRAEQTIP
jgi:beta-lactamase regulating signal transducer with metallopeptidase domain